jgi:hypothetical protein
MESHRDEPLTEPELEPLTEPEPLPVPLPVPNVFEPIELPETVEPDETVEPAETDETIVRPIIMPIPISLSQLLTPLINEPDTDEGVPTSLEEQIQQQSFHESNQYIQVCNKDFINSLSVQKVTPEMVEKKITCGICLDELTEGDDVIELPCVDKHYFHIKRENCEGIYPWLKQNNTCPMCRHVFPSEVKRINAPEISQEQRTPLRPINLMRIINDAIQEQEERMLQESILQSLVN